MSEEERRESCADWNEASLSGGGACIRRRQVVLMDSRALVDSSKDYIGWQWGVWWGLAVWPLLVQHEQGQGCGLVLGV